jgi:hypothetical protein
MEVAGEAQVKAYLDKISMISVNLNYLEDLVSSTNLESWKDKTRKENFKPKKNSCPLKESL